MVIVRKAVKEDLNSFLKIYSEARDKFKKKELSSGKMDIQMKKSFMTICIIII